MKNYKVTVNGNVYDVTVEETVRSNTSAVVPVMPAHVVQAAPVTPAAPAPVQEAATVVKTTVPSGVQGAIKVKSPMPGKILKIEVKQGETVKKGQIILILEAMKMENEIVAPQDGTISSVDVSVGISVESGDLLVTLN